MKRVCVIGNFSGRNAGDAAILGGLLADVTAEFGPGILFDVPTIKPAFVARRYAAFNVKPTGLLPWNLSVKILGLPIVRSVLAADLVLVTDAILFDRKLFNPLFNYLSTMALVLPLARRRGIPVVLYNVSLGPADTRAGARCLRRVIDAANEVIVRDDESLELMDRLGIPRDGFHRGADCALNVTPTGGDALDAILDGSGVPRDERPIMTVNVNSYLNVFLKEGSRRWTAEAFADCMAAVLDRVIGALDVNVVVVETQPMDLKLTGRVLERLRQRDRVGLVTNVEHSYGDLAGVFSRAELHVGMRTHSLILATSVGTPVVGIIATPKNRGYMRSIEQDARMVEFVDLTEDHLVDVITRAWEERAAIREELKPTIEREKEKARAGAKILAPFMG